MSGRDLPGAARIEDELAETEHSFARLWRRIDRAGQDARDDSGSLEVAYEELEPLGVEVRPVMIVQLSWGGPSDWLEVELDPENPYEVTGVTYHFADWFDQAEREVSERSAPAVWRAAEYYAEAMAYRLGQFYGEAE